MKLRVGLSVTVRSMKEVDNVHTSCHELVVEREGRQLVVLPDQNARKHPECEWGHAFHLGSNAAAHWGTT